MGRLAAACSTARGRLRQLCMFFPVSAHHDRLSHSRPLRCSASSSSRAYRKMPFLHRSAGLYWQTAAPQAVRAQDQGCRPRASRLSARGPRARGLSDPRQLKIWLRKGCAATASRRMRPLSISCCTRNGRAFAPVPGPRGCGTDASRPYAPSRRRRPAPRRRRSVRGASAGACRRRCGQSPRGRR